MSKKECDDLPDITLWLEAIKRCKDHAGNKRGVTGTIKCPKCGGNLNYSVSGYNGHLWGKCETQGCLSWMQ